MKKITTILTTMVLSCAALLAQAPSKFSYQAVVRNSSGIVVPSGTSVSFRFTIRDGSAGGAVLFQETQIKSTNNAFGLVNLEIGAGTVQQGAYPTASQWASGAKFLQVEVDPAGGVSYSDMGATQISAVPYANYANAAGSANNLSGTVQPSQITAGGASSGQVLQYNGSNWVPVTLDGDISEVIAGTGLLGGGNSGSVTVNANTTSALWNANALQGTAVSVTAPSSGQTLKYNGSTWAPATDDNTTYSAGTGLSLSGTTFNSVWTTSGASIFNNNSGNVGIGTSTPASNTKLYVKGTGSSLFEDFLVEGSSSLNGMTLKPTNASTITGLKFAQSTGSSFNASILFAEAGAYAGNFVISADNAANTTDITINKSTKNVGIGSINASYELDVTGKFRATKDAMVEGKMSIGTTATPTYAQLIYSNGGIATAHYQTNTTGTSSSDGLMFGLDNNTGDAILWNWENKYLKFGTNGVERMRILGSGFVGINNVGPGYQLDVSGGSARAINGSSSTSSLTDGAVYGVNTNGPFSALGTNNNGIYAKSIISNGAAVFADNNASNTVGYAGYFSGRMHVNGTLSKSSGSFKIDHPLDPENKFLYHSFVESPDMMNIYNGNVVLDANGQATITMPDWFQALNMEFRYQLSCIGGYAPVYISKKVEGNQFSIAGGSPGLEVSWQVTGVRHDNYADQNRIQVEVEKTEFEKGYYMTPEAFGQPKEKGIGYKMSGAEAAKPAQQVPAGKTQGVTP
ncbi:MAG: hypothetical protein IT244_10795 [Bacteroidia bacterium]|nr:hypothetical protein [Bacteroidia bacterium]